MQFTREVCFAQKQRMDSSDEILDRVTTQELFTLFRWHHELPGYGEEDFEISVDPLPLPPPQTQVTQHRRLFLGGGGSKLHVDISATTRVACPTWGEPAARGRVNHSRGTPRQPWLPPK